MSNPRIKTLTGSTCLAALLGLVLFVGCSSAQKTSPGMGFASFSLEAEIGRDDVVVLDTVEGTSTSLMILGGIVEIVDGDKIAVLGIKFFKDKYTYWKDQSFFDPASWLANTASRAYYHALEQTPEADMVFMKSMDNEDDGIPFIYYTKTVTWRGKALKLKADQ